MIAVLWVLLVVAVVAVYAYLVALVVAQWVSPYAAALGSPIPLSSG